MKKRDEIKDIKVFAAGIGVICSLLALLSWWKGGSAWPYLAGFGALFALSGLISPPFIRPVYSRWMAFAQSFGRLQTKLILSLVFYLIVTPVGVLMRLIGKDLLDRKIDKEAESHWKEPEPERDISRYNQQF
jgi:hypothetical protein